ncbi:MAG: type II secretion system F family protein [Candidatus Paceibacterota bacterium]|jgi:type IV pilus assembly protein PilC|nr:type II secretion system F family protein [Candidatus Paceibacterota bacterium]
MLFNYKALNQAGVEEVGTIDAINMDVAINSLQRRNFVIETIIPENSGSFMNQISLMFERVSLKDLVMLSSQVSILFNSHVSVLRIFRLLADGAENPTLGRTLNEVADDIQGGESLSGALGKHPTVFSEFYVNMVKAGEESGKLSETFEYLASYMERSYALTSKTKNALVYPAFVIFTFIGVMVLMLIVVIPKLSAVLIEGGQAIPIYTQVVIGLSNFMINYGLFALIFLIIAGVIFWKVGLPGGSKSWSSIKLKLPLFGRLFKKTYLSRIADNLDTMLASGVPMLRSIEIAGKVVGDDTYAAIMFDAGEKVKAGSSLSDAFSDRPEIPPIMVQMVKVGEETGELSTILKTLAVFYKREADSMVDTMVGLIEPIMIVLLAVGVGFLLASVLIPIYNITASI